MAAIPRKMPQKTALSGGVFALPVAGRDFDLPCESSSGRRNTMAFMPGTKKTPQTFVCGDEVRAGADTRVKKPRREEKP